MTNERELNPWAYLPKQYVGRWSFDYDDKNSVFFVYTGGYRILSAEDSEVCDAVCRAHNASLHQSSEDRPERPCDCGASADNKAVAMRAAVESIVTLCAMEAEWKPGDPRCDHCDNGILAAWVACPYCGHEVLKNEPES